MHPAVSVIVTAYNVEPYIDSAIRSALAQTFADLEVLAVDDGSTDGTAARIARIQDPRLHLHQIPHGGAVAAFNTGLTKACGQWVAFLDGDDVWLPHFLERQLALHTTYPTVDLSFGLSRMIDEQGSDLGLTSRGHAGTIGFEDLFRDNVIGNGSAVLVRTDALTRAGRFDGDFEGCYDLDLWLRITQLRPANVRCVPEVLSLYRRRSGQATRDWALMERSWLRLLDKAAAARPETVRELAPLASSNMYRFFAFAAYEGGEFGSALRLLRTSFAHHASAFLGNSRNLALVTAVMMGLVLPNALHRTLDRWARRVGPW